jgi:hypothetical protein
MLYALFAWLISHQPTVLFSQSKPATNNQPIVLFSQNKPAPAISHQPNEQAVRCLAYDHLVEDCRDPVHCRWCFRNGHRRSCYTMAGVFLCPLWPRSPARSSSLEESSSPRLDLTSSPAAWRAACTSSVVEQRRLQWLPAPLGPGIL